MNLENISPGARRGVMAAASVLVLVVGYLSAYRLRWYGDDIFISLRYAENFLNGNGLVYNVGERVDGFTHFLWLAVLTALQRLGYDPVAVSLNLGVVSFVGVLALFAFISYRMADRGSGLVLPFTSLAFLANTEARIWATSGLETAFFTLLLSLAFFFAFFSGFRQTRRMLLAGFFLALAVLTRPDAVLFWGTGFLFLAARLATGAADRREALRDLALFAAPFLVLVVPYQAWRTAYYGDFFPNTYYAKSGGLSYYSQGFTFLWLYFRAHPTSLLFLGAVPVLIRGWRRAASPGRGAALVAFVGIVVYLVLFVARVGGGFMYARFVVPILPFAYFLAEWALYRGRGRRRMAGLAALLVLPLFIATFEHVWRDDLLLKPEENGRRGIRDLSGVVDEHYYYTHWYPIELEGRLGAMLRPYVADLDVTVLLRGQACLGYYGGFRTCIENAGLTDAYIAHLPLKSRHRVGHEKSAPYEYLVERGVNFLFNRTPYRNVPYRMVVFTMPEGVRIRAEMITYDAGLMNTLARRMGAMIEFTPFDQVLDGYIQEMLPGRPRDQLARDYRDFKEFYFDHNDDPVRQQVFEDALSVR